MVPDHVDIEGHDDIDRHFLDESGLVRAQPSYATLTIDLVRVWLG